MTSLSFALNHMAAPSLSLEELFQLASSLGISSVEIRNDIAANAILDGTPAPAVKALAQKFGQTIISINALQRFNEWSEARASEAQELISYAEACGALALVLVPVNDGSGQKDGERQANLRQALEALKPMLDRAGIIGLVEPLGFEICSLRSKTEAVAAIVSIGGQETFKVVHDTFHHALSGDETFHPDMTGLVHISGVTDTNLSIGELRDAHRVLVDAEDRLDNVGQIRTLRSGGYAGLFSFEPFSDTVHQSSTVKADLERSMAYVRHQL